MRRLKIAFVAPPGGLKRSTWSGIPYHMKRALQEHCGDVVEIAPEPSLGELLGKARDRVSRKLRGRGRAYTHTPALARRWGRSLAKQLPRDADVVFAPAGSTSLAFLDADIPIVYTSDTTFHLISEYYPEFSDLPRSYVAWGNEIEQRALDRSALALYPSEWAAASARDDYGASPEKVFAFPYGANLDRAPDPAAIPASKASSHCTVTFLGVDWERKGGPIAYDAVRTMREMGIDARFEVIGCSPPRGFDAPWMSVTERIDKGTPAGAEELSARLLGSSFLLLPTRRECYGIVFCEASAHGTPSIATATGGVAGAVQDDENGFLLSPEAPAKDYAVLMAELFTARERYGPLVSRTRRAFDVRLNWDAWARKVEGLMTGLTAAGGAR
jgi:glycosyltransferase involved in cell wall biosynthesis